MDNRLPLIINYDLQGYRGFGVTEFPLSFRVIDGKIIGSYSNDKAGYALYTEIGSTKEEVIEMLFKSLKKDGFI